ncbi:BTB/POZ domain-containing protein [Colletotrichum salicis]|uniref:BTB/POZ domain-containing protein n=1 Tax=Colletotrichum salicis TaxID=1209931 RepID=A0A135VAL6_9PEZI|nr:BTB/POZ domain-containing protein [Colletotrichum salicis]
MPRQTKNTRNVYAEPTRSERIRVCRNSHCRAIFSNNNNNNARSLLKDSLFESSYSARAAFPELSPPQEPSVPVPAPYPAPAAVPAQPTMDPPGQPQKDLYASLETLYSTGKYSDLTICSTTKEYHVHRAIVCPRSEFLDAACRNSFKEASDGVISLLDDESCVVDMMLQYFYRLDYQHSIDTEHLARPSEQSQDDGAESSDLLLHAKVYGIAEKYVVSGLKGLALSKFESAALNHWGTSDFLEAINEAYTSTLETDRGLRDVILKVFSKHKELLDRDEVKTLLRGIGSLAYDLVIHYHQENGITSPFRQQTSLWTSR